MTFLSQWWNRGMPWMNLCRQRAGRLQRHLEARILGEDAAVAGAVDAAEEDVGVSRP